MSNIAPNIRGFLDSASGVWVLPLSTLGAGVLATAVVVTVGVGSPRTGTGGGRVETCGVCATALETPASRTNSPTPEETPTLFNLETEITLPLF
jgi:hypothetical protein